MSATRHSFAQFGCAAFADNARTYAYHRWACANDMYPSECQPDLFECACDLDDPLIPYVDPASDPAPWYDANDPASTEFLGAMITKVDGANDSTIKRDPVDAFGDGTILNRARLAGRSFTFEMLLLSTSCRGADFGVEWLRRVFETDLCLCGEDPCGSCYGKRLTLRRSCEDADPCDTGLRSWESVGVVDGIKIQADDDLAKCCCVAQRVTLVLQSESPYSYGCEDIACNQTVDPEGFTVCYDWSTGCLECCTDKACDRCLNDPLCSCFAAQDPEPQSATSTEDCFCEPIQKYVQCCCIEDVGNAAYDTALRIELFSGFDVANDEDALAFTELGLRNVRVSIFDNPENLTCISDEDSYQEWCESRIDPRFEIEIPYVPSNAMLVLDGRSNRAILECEGSCRPFPYQISNTKGKLFPLVTNCASMMLCIEWDVFNTQDRSGLDKQLSSATVTTYRRWLS
jgi:hypothetical protein